MDSRLQITKDDDNLNDETTLHQILRQNASNKLTPTILFTRYHNSRMINYDAERGINVTTDPMQRLSDLLIPAASVSHAGNYTCVPNNAVPASIYVHIFNGEYYFIYRQAR